MVDCRFNQLRALLSLLHSVPLLAEEGVKLEVGGEGKRGGLLVEDPNSSNELNLLQILADSTDVASMLVAMTKFRESKLFRKEDVTQYQLLYSIELVMLPFITRSI